MSEKTKIQWCDHTHNPWRGCRKVAPECDNCYIVETPPLRSIGQKHGAERVRAGEATLREPYRWNAAAEKAGTRRRVFCLSLGDWLDDENVPIEWTAELLRTIFETQSLDWLLLTKRPQNWKSRMKEALQFFHAKHSMHTRPWGDTNFLIWLLAWIGDSPDSIEPAAPMNVWIGVSQGADQDAALSIPARIHFLSCEPMLHQLDETHARKFDWIIFGGESGRKARELQMEWIQDGVKFCHENGVSAFVKQMGARPTAHGRLVKFKHSHGGDMDEWPESLRVREFPKT